MLPRPKCLNVATWIGHHKNVRDGGATPVPLVPYMTNHAAQYATAIDALRIAPYRVKNGN